MQIDAMTLRNHLRIALEQVNDKDLIRDLRHIVATQPADVVRRELSEALAWRMQPVREHNDDNNDDSGLADFLSTPGHGGWKSGEERAADPTAHLRHNDDNDS